MKQAINLAHDERRAFMWLQYDPAGRICCVHPYYNEVITERKSK